MCESGFLPEERRWFSDFLACGFVDTFRETHPDKPGCFTWWPPKPIGRNNPYLI